MQGITPDDQASALGGNSVPSLRRTYLFEAELGHRREGDSAKAVFAAAAKRVIEWFDEKVPGQLTPLIYDLRTDSIDQFGIQSLTTVSNVDEGYWAGRLRYADRARGREAAVPGRTWTSEVVLRTTGDRVRFSTQMFMASRPGVSQFLQYDRPELVRILEASFGLKDITQVTSKVPEVKAAGLKWLVEHPQRRRSVVMLTKPPGDSVGFPYLLDRQELGKQLMGIAWAVALPPDQTFEWTRLVGHDWTAYNGAVRTFKPLLDWNESDPYDHPRTFPDVVLNWKYDGETGEGAFRRFLVEQCVRDQSDMRHSLSEGMSFNEISELDSIARRKAASNEDLLDLADKEIDGLKRQLGELQDRYDTLAMDSEMIREELEAERRRARILVSKNSVFEHALRTRNLPLEERPVPSAYDQFRDWCEEEFAGKLTVMPRAYRALKAAEYCDVKLVGECLRTLAHEGWNWCAGQPSAKDAFLSACQRLGVHLDEAITDTRAGEENDAYFPEFPRGSGTKHKLRWHLKKGNDRDPRNCLRVYFFWHDDSQTVVVGHLPSHLPIRSSN